MQTWLITYLKERIKKGSQDLEGLPRNMKPIAEEQDTIGWANFAERGMTRGIRGMQTLYMCNRGLAYTEDHWMRDLIKKNNGTNTLAIAKTNSYEVPPHQG